MSSESARKYNHLSHVTRSSAASVELPPPSLAARLGPVSVAAPGSDGFVAGSKFGIDGNRFTLQPANPRRDRTSSMARQSMNGDGARVRYDTNELESVQTPFRNKWESNSFGSPPSSAAPCSLSAALLLARGPKATNTTVHRHWHSEAAHSSQQHYSEHYGAWSTPVGEAATEPRPAVGGQPRAAAGGGVGGASGATSAARASRRRSSARIYRHASAPSSVRPNESATSRARLSQR